MDNIQSRVRAICFPWDMYNFVNDDSVDEKIETIVETARSNNILNLQLSYKYTETWEGKSDGYAGIELASYLKQIGGYIVHMETPMPFNIRIENHNIVGYQSSGFGHCRVIVFYVKNFEDIKGEISKIEDDLLREIYNKEK